MSVIKVLVNSFFGCGFDSRLVHLFSYFLRGLVTGRLTVG